MVEIETVICINCIRFKPMKFFNFQILDYCKSEKEVDYLTGKVSYKTILAAHKNYNGQCKDFEQKTKKIKPWYKFW